MKGVLFLNKLLDRLEYKYRRFGIDNLILYIVGAMVMIFVAALFYPDILTMLNFDRDMIFQGQVWRVLTFLIMPTSTSIISMIFGTLLIYAFGSSLERTWGSFRFTVYYFMGAIFNIAAGFIMGYTDNYYLMMSIFLAYAVLFPNDQIYFYFLIPIKMKWLGMVAGIFMLIKFLLLDLVGKITIVAVVLNFILFFGGDFITKVVNYFKYKPARDKFKKNMREVERRRNDGE